MDSFDRSVNFLFKKDDARWVPGVNSLHNVTLLEADMVLKGIPTKDVEKGGKKK